MRVVLHAAQLMIDQVSFSVAIALGNWGLGLSGYINPDDRPEGEEDIQDPMVLTTLRVLVSWIPLILLALSFVTVNFYNISREKYAYLPHAGLH